MRASPRTGRSGLELPDGLRRVTRGVRGLVALLPSGQQRHHLSRDGASLRARPVARTDVGGSMTANDKEPGQGMPHSAFDVFLDRTRAVIELVTAAGTAGARAVVPDPVLGPVSRMLTSLRTIAEQAPQLTDEL